MVPLSVEKAWWMCVVGHTRHTSWSSVRHTDHGCPYCSGARRLSYVAPEVVRAFFQESGLTKDSYAALFKAKKVPEGFPCSPRTTYGKQWSWFTGNDRLNQTWVKSEVVRSYMQRRHLDVAGYKRLSREGKLPRGFPSEPHQRYERPWSWFIGNERDWVKPEVVRAYFRKHKLSMKSYLALAKGGKLPRGFPSAVMTVYRKPGSWFSGETASYHKVWVKPEVVRAYFRKNRVSSVSWDAICKAGERPKNFPRNPVASYQKPWSWFTGRGRRGRAKIAR